MANPLDALNTGATGQGMGDTGGVNLIDLYRASPMGRMLSGGGSSGPKGYGEAGGIYTPREEYFKVDPTGVLSREWQRGRTDAAQREAYDPMLDRASSTNAQQMRMQQLENLAMLKAQAEGRTGPSQAEQLVARERERNISQSMALAASGQGMSPAAALRQAQQQGGAASIAAAQQGSEIRAAEQAQAAQMYTQGLAGIREQDYSQMSLEQRENIAQMQAMLQSEMGQRQLNDNMVQSYLSMGMSLEQARLQANIAIEQLRAEQQIALNQGDIARSEGAANRRSSVLGGILTAGGLIGAAAMFSDKNAKENIDEGAPAISKFMDALESYEFDYKDEAHGEGRQYGIMTQDLEKSEAGKSIVRQIGQYKAIDTVKAVGPILSSIAALNKRQKQLEKILREK